MTETKKTFDLEDRLIRFSTKVIILSESFPNTYFGNHAKEQITRSGSSPLLNYGEAQVAESPKDFIHKMKICLKELKETRNSLLLINSYLQEKKEGVGLQKELGCLTKECGELCSIFYTSIRTAKRGLEKTLNTKH